MFVQTEKWKKHVKKKPSNLSCTTDVVRFLVNQIIELLIGKIFLVDITNILILQKVFSYRVFCAILLLYLNHNRGNELEMPF